MVFEMFSYNTYPCQPIKGEGVIFRAVEPTSSFGMKLAVLRQPLIGQEAAGYILRPPAKGPGRVEFQHCAGWHQPGE